MIKMVPMASVLILGGAIGLGLGWFAWGRVDRVAASLSLMNDVCLKYVKTGREENVEGLQRYKPFPTGVYYWSARPQLLLHMGENNCRVSDRLAVFSDSDRDRLAAEVRKWALQKLPNASFEDNSDLETTHFFVFKDQSPRRLLALSFVSWRELGDFVTDFSVSQQLHGDDDA